MEPSRAEIDLEIERERLFEIQRGMRFICSRFALPLYMVFWFADLLYAPDRKWEFLLLRLCVVPVGVWIYNNIEKYTSLPQVELISFVNTVICSSIINIMIFYTGGSNSLYYAGLNLISVGSFYFVPWRSFFLWLLVATNYGPYYTFAALEYYKTGSIGSINSFLVNGFFVTGTVVIALSIRLFHLRVRREVVKGNLALKAEITSRETVIRQKTDEAVQLTTLSRQFSPQVVEAIRTGQTTLSSGVHRSLICALFIDVVNSTNRVTRIDQGDLSKVIGMFMDDTIRVLLKYDLTVDKFLGDGVLAFSNDPIHRADFVERALSAAIEINQKIKGRQDDYLNLWLNKFEIRCGLASGYANVGFYGSEKYFRSYTAIGPVMNLAARLCSEAQPNQIFVSHDVERRLRIREQGFEINYIGAKTLKGFEEDLLKVYQVNYSLSGGPDSTVNSECPKCTSLLHIETDANGLFILKCRNCGLEQSSTSFTKKKAA